MKTIKTLTAIVLTAVLAFVISGCSSDGGDDPVLPLPPAHVHAYSDSWTSNETHHWHAATCEHDVKKDEASHEWDHEDFQYDAASGNEIRTCSVCGYVNSKTHVHTWDHEDFQLDAASGKEIKTCTVCGFVADKNHAHTEDSGTVTTAPTCVTKGVKTYKCTVCGEALRTEEIPATDHTEDSGTVTTAPTCVTKGVKTYKCTVCGEALRTEEIPATDHTEDSGTVTPPTCVTKGVKTYKCTVCGEILRTEEIPELYSSPVDAGTGQAATKSSKYIYFGVFPKTVLPKGSTVIVDETISVKMGADTYYKGSDGEYYVNVNENAYNTGTEYNYSDGTQAKMKSSNRYRYFKVEPIKWKVITNSYSGKCLLLAEDILTANVPYYKSNSLSNTRIVGSYGVYSSNYKYSQIRAYLNGLDYYYYDVSSTSTVKKTLYTDKGFLQTAFTAGAQNLIAVTTVDNSAASTIDSGNNLSPSDYTCEDTKDKIFLLSIKEATSYGFPAYNEYGQGNARIRKPTDYAKANYAYQDFRTDYGGRWWLRSPSYDYGSFHVQLVYGIGRADDDSDFDGAVDYTKYGVVPALCLELK